MPITIRFAQPKDAPQLLRLNEAFNGPGDQTPEGIRTALEAPGPEQVFVAEAEESGALIGFCCCLLKRSFCYQEPSGEITEFFVDPAWRRQGAGRALLAFAVRFCESQRVSELTLLTGDDNFTAQAFYKSLGFSPTGELHMAL